MKRHTEACIASVIEGLQAKPNATDLPTDPMSLRSLALEYLHYSISPCTCPNRKA